MSLAQSTVTGYARKFGRLGIDVLGLNRIVNDGGYSILRYEIAFGQFDPPCDATFYGLTTTPGRVRASRARRGNGQWTVKRIWVNWTRRKRRASDDHQNTEKNDHGRALCKSIVAEIETLTVVGKIRRCCWPSTEAFPRRSPLLHGMLLRGLQTLAAKMLHYRTAIQTEVFLPELLLGIQTSSGEDVEPQWANLRMGLRAHLVSNTVRIGPADHSWRRKQSLVTMVVEKKEGNGDGPTRRSRCGGAI